MRLLDVLKKYPHRNLQHTIPVVDPSSSLSESESESESKSESESNEASAAAANVPNENLCNAFPPTSVTLVNFPSKSDTHTSFNLASKQSLRR